MNAVVLEPRTWNKFICSWAYTRNKLAVILSWHDACGMVSLRKTHPGIWASPTPLQYVKFQSLACAKFHLDRVALTRDETFKFLLLKDKYIWRHKFQSSRLSYSADFPLGRNCGITIYSTCSSDYQCSKLKRNTCFTEKSHLLSEWK